MDILQTNVFESLRFAVNSKDITKYLTKISNNNSVYKLLELYKELEKVTNENSNEILVRYTILLFLVYNEDISLDEAVSIGLTKKDLTNENLIHLLKMYIGLESCFSLKEYKIVPNIPKIYYNYSKKNGYSGSDNIRDEFFKILERIDGYDDFWKFVKSDMKITPEYFLRINDEPSGIEKEPSIWSFIANYKSGDYSLISEYILFNNLKDVPVPLIPFILSLDSSTADENLLKYRDILLKIIKELNRGTINY